MDFFRFLQDVAPLVRKVSSVLKAERCPRYLTFSGGCHLGVVDPRCEWGFNPPGKGSQDS